MGEIRFMQAFLLLALVQARTPIHPHDDKARRQTNTVKGRSQEILKHAVLKTWQGPTEFMSPKRLRGNQESNRALKSGGKFAETFGDPNGGKKSSTKHGKKKGAAYHYNGDQTLPINPPHPTSPPSQGADDAIVGSNCFSRLEEELFQFPAIETTDSSRAVFIDYGIQNEQELGTVYIYSDPLADQAIETLESSFVAGHCVRTQMRIMQGTTFIAGGGYCHFTYTLFDGVQSVTFTAEGEVFDFFGGKLAVSGGTGYFTGVAGFIKLTPVLVGQGGEFTESDAEFFSGPDDSNAFGYLADAKLVVNTCLPNLEQE